ncbi:hypothetical protein CCACVL1_22543 [Corchorus capsularis]|uniref:non-specific serine/threonine protein kinase n=1 Tax=Corchorus capsularis TaxID=210143 RepID=A0A1R3GY89_COCAP|nr:hypothetical protein CCACVL1_22543 [Corchorus capsularis]
MFSHPKFMLIFQVSKLLLQATLIISSLTQIQCLNFSYSSFSPADANDFVRLNSSIINNVIQISPVTADASGRILYKEPLKLWDKLKGTKSSFTSTFVINIKPQTSPGGEGSAFILTDSTTLPSNSAGQWLGIVNVSTINRQDIVAVEFDTRKSDSEDLDDNHVGVDVQNIYSIKQESLASHGANLSSSEDITARIQYDAKSDKISVFVSLTSEQNMGNPVLSAELDLSEHLPQDVFVGFSGSTGEYVQVNAVKSWDFISFETRVKGSVNLVWLWILIPFIVVILLGGFAYLLYRRYKNRMKENDNDELEIEKEIQRSSSAPQKFRLKELKAATGNFNGNNKLGSGGFGTVYKGILRKDEFVAVKRILKNTRHGKQDFIAEVTSISNLHHKNLVKLLGWCYESNELLLVYEFMPNGSLDKFIFTNTSPNDTIIPTLTWETRHNIICGVARALDYLHNCCEKRVIHRDIKASNIMLDSEFNARLGDFGLARTIQLNEKTHHSTKGIAGTPGYMAPECFHTGKATVETDIYAFGVLILEVVCGRKPGHQTEENNYNCSIVEWVWEHHRMGTITDVVDFRLDKDFDKDQAQCILVLGLACCHPNPFERPSMRIALQVLTGEVAAPTVPIEKPAFMWPAMAPIAVIREDMDSSISGGQLTATMDLSGR